MKNLAAYADGLVKNAGRVAGHTEEDWKVLASVRAVTTAWAPLVAKTFGNAVYAAGSETGAMMERYDRRDREQAIAVWYERLVSGAPGASFWAETALIGFYHAAAGVRAVHVVAMAGAIDELFLASCTRAFPGPKALQVYQAFHRIFGMAMSVMAESAAHAVVAGMETMGFSEKLVNRMRSVSIRKMIEEGRGAIPVMVWDDALSVGVGEVDSQHQVLIGLLNQLHEGRTAGKGNDALAKILGELATYTVEHFTFEERLLEEHGYPELPGHKESHRKLTQKVFDFKGAFEAGQGTLSADLFLFLRSWLNGHIRGSDRQYGRFLNARGVH